MSGGIHVDDLEHPRFSAEARRIIAALSENPLIFSTEAIVAEAERECDVPFIWEEAALGRLRRYVDELRRPDTLTELGKRSIFGLCKGALIQRSRLEHLYATHPEIEDVEVEKPLIIAGLPRSGTTFLLNLLAQDDGLSGLPFWEGIEPIPAQSVIGGAAPDDRPAKAEAVLRQGDILTPYRKNMYDVGLHDVQEDVVLQYMTMGTMALSFYGHIPEWMRDYWEADQLPHYRFQKRVLKALQWLRGAKRWILKSPQHLAFLPELSQVFPGAPMVVTHRDPAGVFPSVATFLAYGQRIFYDHVDLGGVVSEYRSILHQFLGRMTADVKNLAGHPVHHLQFDALNADPIGAIRKLYAECDLPLPASTLERMTDYVAARPRGRHGGRLIYDLEGDFGLRADDLRKEFKFYLDAFPVRIEKANE